MSGQPPYFIEPQLASRSATLKETIWLRIGALQTSMNDRDRALDAFERVLRVNPSNIHAMTQVGAVLAKKERYERAVGFLQRAIQAESTCGEAWAVLAHCYVMTDELPKAYQAYQNALNHLQDPSDPNLWYGIGLLYDRYGSLDNALEAFLAVLRIAPSFERAIEVCFCIGIIYKEQRKLDEAMQYFNKVSMAPNPPPPLTRADGWYQIGHVNELKRDISKALDMYKLALRENPNHAKTLQNLGWLEHSHKDNSHEAIHLLRKSLEADQNDGQTWYLLGRVYMASREFRQAYDAYQQAVYRDGRNATFWCSIGVLYYQMNQYRDAMDAYARAIRLNPQVSEVWYDLGTLYESCGQTNDAIDAYRRAADLAPESAQITERLTVLQNSLAQGGQPHAPQQSQPLGTQPPLQQPHPQLPPPHAHLSHQPPPPPGLAQPDQVMHSQPQTSQPPLPPAHSTAGHGQMMPNHQLQPILRAPAVQQQPIPMLSQPQAQPPSSGHQHLPRHIMQHPLQQPPGAGSTALPHVPHSMPNHLRPGSLPHLTVPTSQPGTSSALGPQAGAMQRSEPDRALPPPQGQRSHLPGSGPLLPLSHPLPQLPSLQAQQDSTTPGGTGPQQRQQGKRDDGTPARDGQNNQPPLPQLRIVPKEGVPNQLEQIPSLQRPDGPGYGQTSRPDGVGGVLMPPIPSLAPLVANNKPGGDEGPTGQQRLPPAGVVSDPNKASAPLAGVQGPDDSTAESHSTKPSQGNPKDSTSQDSRAVPNGGPIRQPVETTGNGSTGGRKDAELLHSIGTQNDESKHTLPAVSTAGTGASSSPSVPALPIRSAPPPRPNKDEDLHRPLPLPNKEAGDSRFPSLGSSLSKFGRSKPTPVTGTKIAPPSLPSPLSAPTRKLVSPLNGTSGTTTNLAPPLKSAPVGGSLGGEAIPSPNSLPVLPAISGKVADGVNNSGEKIPSIKTHEDGDKKSNGVEGSSSGLEKPRPFGIPRAMPSISSLNNSHGDNERESSSSKREASPSADADKTYKRPRVGDSPRSEDREGDSRMTDVGNGDKDRRPIPLMNNASLPTVRQYRERAQQRKSPVLSMGPPLLRSKPDPQNAASAPYRVKGKKEEEKVGEAEKAEDGPS